MNKEQMPGDIQSAVDRSGTEALQREKLDLLGQVAMLEAEIFLYKQRSKQLPAQALN